MTDIRSITETEADLRAHVRSLENECRVLKETLRDRFAMAALGGLYAADTVDSVVPVKTKIAEAFCAADEAIVGRASSNATPIRLPDDRLYPCDPAAFYRAALEFLMYPQIVQIIQRARREAEGCGVTDNAGVTGA